MKQTELITNQDGSIFHLKLKPGELSDKIIIVGDPGRVEMIGGNLDKISMRRSNREFHSITGSYKSKRISVISSGIGTDNIDILINEVDALFNYDLSTKKRLDSTRSIDFIRVGTSGALQSDLQPGEIIISKKAVGFDGVMNFYSGIEEITDPEFEKAFMEHMAWPKRWSTPYIINADKHLYDKFIKAGYTGGITISTPGFYAPQGRTLHLEPYHKDINDRFLSFSYKGERILNYEMESSAIYGLSSLLGHRAITLCSAIGNRVSGKFVSDYKPIMNELSKKVLDII